MHVNHDRALRLSPVTVEWFSIHVVTVHWPAPAPDTPPYKRPADPRGTGQPTPLSWDGNKSVIPPYKCPQPTMDVKFIIDIQFLVYNAYGVRLPNGHG